MKFSNNITYVNVYYQDIREIFFEKVFKKRKKPQKNKIKECRKNEETFGFVISDYYI